ncbi:MAG: hypothetical protein ITG02_10950 [Patulibacter sp.]|nr:hypothetical protein [Patulibacter sp.]
MTPGTGPRARPSLVVSDLHLGSASDSDLLRHPGAAQDALLGALDGVERLVVAGDLLELRHGPARTVLERARPFLRRLGATLGPDRELLVLAGNHDHRMVRPWLLRRRLDGEQLLLDSAADAADVSEVTAAIATAVGEGAPAGPRVRVAYPAAWLVPPRDGDGGAGTGGVLVSHGHYVDAVWRMPTMERLASAVAGHSHGMTADGLRTPEDFEQVLGPAYGWMDGLAEYATSSGLTRSQRTSSGVWRRINADRGWRGVALRRAVPVATRALERAGLGRYEPRLTPDRLRIAGNQGVARAFDQLGVAPDALIVGHTHRAGPLPGDVPWEWRLPRGGALLNCGAWVHNGPRLDEITDQPDAYRPGRAVRLEADGVPRLVDLLDR